MIIELFRLFGQAFQKMLLPQRVRAFLDWEGLGKKVATYIPNYTYTNAIDALSLFESEFSRTKLHELLARELYVNDLKCREKHIGHFAIFILILFARQILISSLNKH